MTDRGRIKSLIEQAYGARQSGDIGALMTAFHPDCKLEIVGAKPHAQAAVIVRGHAELRAALTTLIDTFHFVQRDFLDFIVEDDRAAVRSRVALRYVPKHRIETTEIVDLWKFQDGRVIELIEFVDTALVNDMMR